jgi:ribosome modulation factor
MNKKELEKQFIDPFFKEGFDDFYQGYSKEECPYDEGTDGQCGWLKGFRAAELEEKQLLNDERNERNSRGE